MKTIAKVLALTLAILMVAALFAACGAAGSETESKKETTKETAEQGKDTEKATDASAETDKSAETAKETDAETDPETDPETEPETDPETEPETTPEPEDPELTFINWNDTDKYTLTGGAITTTSGSKFLDGTSTTRVRTQGNVDAKVNLEYTFSNKDLRKAAIGVLLCSQRMGTTIEVSTDNEKWTHLIVLDSEDTRLPYDQIIPGTTVMAPCDANWNVQIYDVGDILTAAHSQKLYVRLGTRSVTPDVDYVKGGNDNTGADLQIGFWFTSDPQALFDELQPAE